MIFTKLKAAVSCFAFSAFAVGMANADEWPSLNVYTFTLDSPSVSMTLNGCTTSECQLDNGSALSDSEKIGDLAVYAARYTDGNCYLQGGFCSSSYLVEQGSIDDGSGNIMAAFKIHPAANDATSFVASRTKLMFRFNAPLESSYTILEYIPGLSGAPATFVSKSSVEPGADGEYVMTDVDISQLSGESIFTVVPSDNAPSIWPEAQDGTTTQKAQVFSLNAGGTQLGLFAQLFDVSPAMPFDPASGWPNPPDAHNQKYGFRRIFTRALKSGGNDDGVIWQDQTDWKIYVTWFTSSGHDTIELPNTNSGYLFAAASDGGSNGDIIYITLARENAGDKVTPLAVTGRKVDMDGNIQVTMEYDTSENGLNVYSYFNSGGSMAWDTVSNTFALMISRTMLRGNDGLNHQGCIAVIMDADTLDVIVNRGQTSGHSWNNFIDVDHSIASDFLAVDLGDNFPRGVHVHKISASSKTSKVVYTFKTKHGTSAQSPAGVTYDVYSEISGGGTTFYKWSNDNNVYTEIAHPPAVKRDDGSIIIVFSGERPPLDNSQAIDNSNNPRNVGLVVVSDDLQSIVSTGEDSTGGFYNFGGGWKDQANEGIIWLTDFTPNVADEDNWENALRVKTAQIAEDLILIFYEVWGSLDYIRTDVMGIDTEGNIVFEPVNMPFPLRLAPTDDVMVEDNVVIFHGSDGNNKLIRFHLEEVGLNVPSPTAPTPTSPTSPTPSDPTATTPPSLLPPFLCRLRRFIFE